MPAKRRSEPPWIGKPFDVEDRQAVPLEQRLQRRKAEVKNVLVVNRVELVLLDELCRVGKLKDDAALVA